LGVEAVVLGLAPVDQLHGQCVPEHERDPLVLAQVGEPVPGEHALAPDHQSLAVRLEGVEDGVGRGGQILFQAGGALVVEHVDEEGSGVQVDAAVICVRGVVRAHLMSSLATGRPDPASWLPGSGHG